MRKKTYALFYIILILIISFLALNKFSEKLLKDEYPWEKTTLHGYRADGGYDILFCDVGQFKNNEGVLFNTIKSRYESMEIVGLYGIEPNALDTTEPVNCVAYPAEVFNIDSRVNKFKSENIHGNTITFIGDSFTFGEGVPLGSAFPELIEKKLKKSGLADKYVVRNLGKPGDNFPEIYKSLFKKALEINSDTIIYVWFINDMPKHNVDYSMSPLPLFSKKKFAYYKNPFFSVKGPALFRVLAGGVMKKMINHSIIRKYHYLYGEKNKSGVHEFEEYLIRMKKEAHAHDANFGVVLFPVLAGTSKNYEFKNEHKKVSDFLDRNNIAHWDLTDDLLSGPSASDLWVHQADQHPNSKAHRIAADSIFMFLKDKVSWISAD